jgi:DNA-binding GntR family transcriptional regulator
MSMLNLSSKTVPQLDFDENNRVSLADEALVKLEDAICEGRLRPNQRLIESDLARELSMSRTPLREALRQLEFMGHVTSLPNGGLIVTDHSPKQIQDLYEVRVALELQAVELACERADDSSIGKMRKFLELAAETISSGDRDLYNTINVKFHNELLFASDNARLMSFIKLVSDKYFDRKLVRTMTNGELRRMLKQHESIINALQERNVKKAQKAIKSHFQTALEMAVERL